MRHTRFGAVLGTALLLILSLTACGTDDSSGSDPTSDGSSAAGFPVHIKSALGTADITEQPKRVVTIGWGSQDAALALGVVPVGMQDFTSDSGTGSAVLPWDKEKLGDAEPTLIKASESNMPYEQIAALRPDVILAVYSGVTDAQYAKLSKIAPTVGYPDKPWITSWQDQIKLVGKALGKSGQAAKLTAKTNARIKKAAKKHPEFRGKTIAFGSGTERGKYNFYYDEDARTQLLESLGFTPAPSISKLGAGDSENSFAKAVSLEKIPDLKTDVLVSWYLDPAIKKSIEKNALFKKLPAVRNDAYVALNEPALVYATSAVNVLSLPWMLDRYLPKLSKAAENAGD